MKNARKKIRAGIGLAMMGHEIAKKAVNKLVAEGKLHKEDAKAVLERVKKEANTAAKEVSSHIPENTKVKLKKLAKEAKADAVEITESISEIERLVVKAMSEGTVKGEKRAREIHGKIKKHAKDAKKKVIKTLDKGVNRLLDELLKD
jgi:polyhydroxyalkanoate synthesis regulator phasin